MKRPSVLELVEGMENRHRAHIAQAITLVESSAARHRAQAVELLTQVGDKAGGAHRIGITGVPGVGKSTFIEGLGMRLLQLGHRVAVLAVDPSSSRTGGSILADKTRMERLSADKRAFIRPSPSGGTLGGVTRVTRETMTILEASGFDVILVETVGVGQSETLVSDMVDFFLVLMIAGAGDEFQGIKKGVLELADMIAVNKADGSGRRPAERAAAEYRSALGILAQPGAEWQPPVITCSGMSGEGLDALWQQINLHRELLQKSGTFQSKRDRQQKQWMWAMVEDAWLDRLRLSPAVKKARASLERAVSEGLPAAEAARQLLSLASKKVDTKLGSDQT